MITFDQMLDETFSRKTERPDLTVEEERLQIELAQFGDEAATLTLIRTYGDLLRGQVRRHEARLGTEDARSIAVSGLLEAIHGFDLTRFSGRLVEVAQTYVVHALGMEADAHDAITVPARTRRRFFAILHKAGGDHDLAESIAPENGMTVEVYRAVRQAVAYSTSLSAPTMTDLSVAEDHYATVEDRYLVDAAMKSVDGPERTVSRYAYGFATGEGLSDGEVAETWSLDELGRTRVGEGESVASRAKVQRLRTTALGKMRSALGVA